MVQDLQAVGQTLGIDRTETASLLEQFGLRPVQTAMAEASRAGDKIRVPAAFVKMRAARLAESAAREAESQAKRSDAIDLASQQRRAEIATARRAVENDENAVAAQIAEIPPETLERLKAAALTQMNDVTRATAQRRGFEGSLIWRIEVAKLWQQAPAG
jgi:hypothetical protein